jgi:hypothetical protein
MKKSIIILAILLAHFNCIVVHKDQRNSIGIIPDWLVTDSISFDFKTIGYKSLGYRKLNSIVISRSNSYLFVAFAFPGRAGDIWNAKHNWNGDTLHIESYMASTMYTDMFETFCVLDSELINNRQKIVISTSRFSAAVEINDIPLLPRAMVNNLKRIRKE